MFLKQSARMGLVVVASPFIFMIIAMVTMLRPISACKDGFRGPERMWSSVLDWVRGVPSSAGYWARLAHPELREPVLRR